MASVTITSQSGPTTRTDRPRENGDLTIAFLEAIDSTDTYTPFPTFARSIYDWAIKPVSAADAPTSSTTYSSVPVNVGNGASMLVVYTPPTSSAAGFFTFTCGAGSGKAYLYMWAK